MKIEAIDLFCGAGGLTRGLLDSGVKVKAGFDIDPACEYAYTSNNQGAKFFKKSVADLTGQELMKLWSKSAVKLLAGCAPCQPFSTAANGARDGEDPRYYLLEHFARLVEECKPELVTMENVPAVKSHKPFETFVTRLQQLGYSVWSGSVACQDLGVPQTRRRLVLIASRLGAISPGLPKPEVKPDVTVATALAGLRQLASGEADPHDKIHIARNLGSLNLRRIRASKPGGTWHDWPVELRAPCHKKATGASYRSVYARMRADAPAPTMTTQFYNFGTGRFGHPTQDRSITPREAALIQSFPRSYRFVADDEEVFLATLGRLIGNAVPPKLGEAIGTKFKAHVRECIAAAKL